MNGIFKSFGGFPLVSRKRFIMMNQVVIEGFVCRLNSGVTEGGVMWKRFTLGYRKNKNELGFLNCVAFNQEADRMDRAYVKNGSNLIINGKINSSSYEGKDGKKKYSLGVTVKDFTFLPKGKKWKENTEKTQDLPKDLKDAYDDLD